MPEHTKQVRYTINEHGCAVVESPPRAFASIDVQDVGPDRPNRVVTITADRPALEALAAWALALADPSNIEGHLHFDNEVPHGLFKSERGCELILQRSSR